MSPDTKPYPRIQFGLSGRVIPKKNSKRMFKSRSTGKNFVASSARYKTWQYHATTELLDQRNKLILAGIELPLVGPLTLTIKFEMEGRGHEPDLSNLLEGPQDVMEALGIYTNDKQIVRIIAEKTMNAHRDYCEIILSTV